MSMGILGRKVGMTQVFDAEGRAVPVTVVEAGPCQVVEVRTPEKNGYSAVQLGFGSVKPGSVNRPMKGYFAKNGVEPKRWLREFRVDEGHGYEKGQYVKVDLFSEGETVDVVGVSKGKGYAGVMKRFGFGGGPASHGSSKFHRQPGSSGANSYPGHIFKGKTMPGRMGGERVTVKNLKVFAVDVENNLILLRGAIPGAKDGLVLIRKAAD
ncbi:50S ribosomal protein L3 [Thermanaerovibrio acidaminovorans]|uniref:Large ribosomal subunit protein uL3 n=1 Tax=Thermanaerovibrio acidaminovorans (strain ATCC 49978 / DSM 6589 / Su883) TaxID=525903 RepID=D1B5X5_THEAS|nr:50S ribosomal protein L3 [Thermanaerovibrio acidaminovorans]ACZ19416.1 ribosomal protein L3 [Thermanaerovibrio acidaminovorans DSM 6589]